MSDLPAAERRYNEKEVSQLLKRAAELQRSSPTSPNARGLSLGELEEIAAEAGLDASLLRQAARELDAGRSVSGGLGTKLAGAPLRIVLERILPFEAPESAFETLIPHIQIASATPGVPSQIGRTLTWQTQGPGAMTTLRVVVSIRRGETQVRIEESHGQLAGAIFGGGLGGASGVSIGIGGAVGTTVGSVLLGVGLPVLVLGSAFVGFRTFFSRQSRRRRQILAELMERLTEELTAAADEAG